VLLRGAATMSAAAAALNLLPPGHPQGFNDAFGLFVAHTYNAIRGEAHEGLPTFEDGVRAAVLVDAVLASARSGGWASAPAEDVQSVS
jgi:predicted dehydrogenase